MVLDFVSDPHSPLAAGPARRPGLALIGHPAVDLRARTKRHQDLSARPPGRVDLILSHDPLRTSSDSSRRCRHYKRKISKRWHKIHLFHLQIKIRAANGFASLPSCFCPSLEARSLFRALLDTEFIRTYARRDQLRTKDLCFRLLLNQILK